MGGLYIHIPFCHSKCAYCDFFSTPAHARIDEVVDAIGVEWRLRSHELDGLPHTIYIGGGTPSVLTSAQLERLCASVPVTDVVEEFTIEVNPEDVTAEKVEVWRRCGINRVSMGVQSFSDAELTAVGRRHDAATAVAAYETIRRGGIGNVSLDLIYGLPGQTVLSWRRSVDTLMGLHPEHFSAYSLSYEEGTRLTAMLHAGKLTETPEEDIVQMYAYLCSAAHDAGYEHYEISNFAMSGRRAVHNSRYWDFSAYVGLGPSAHSFDGSLRRVNTWRIKDYLEALAHGKLACEIEEESDTDVLNDRIMVALRTSDGLDLRTLPTDVAEELRRRARAFDSAHLTQSTHCLAIPESAFLTSDAIIREMLI